MQSAKSAAASARETAANVTASAKSGLDKAKATVQEKVEKMNAHDPIQRDMATHKKEEKINQAEHNKHEALEQNAAAKHVAADGTNHHSATGGFTTPDYLTGSDISEIGPIPAHDINVEYPSTGPNSIGSNDPARGPVDAVYPADIGTVRNQAHNAHGGGQTSPFGTSGLIN